MIINFFFLLKALYMLDSIKAGLSLILKIKFIFQLVANSTVLNFLKILSLLSVT